MFCPIGDKNGSERKSPSLPFAMTTTTTAARRDFVVDSAGCRKARGGKSGANFANRELGGVRLGKFSAIRARMFPAYARNVTRFRGGPFLCSFAKSDRAKFETWEGESLPPNGALLPLGVVKQRFPN